MPPKKRKSKPKDLQDVPAWKPTHRRTPARRCHNLSPDEERREAQTTPPPLTSGSQTPEDRQIMKMKPQAVKHAEEEPTMNSPTPLADIAISFADTADLEIPSNRKTKRSLPTSSSSPASKPEPKSKIPANINKNGSDLPTTTQPSTPMITVIPMIKTRNNPDWSILMEHIGEKLQTQEIPGLFTVDSEKNGYIEFYPRSAWEYNMMWDQIIQDGFTIVGPPRWQPTKKPQPPLMPPHTDKMPIQTTTAIPTIKTRSNPDWSILTGHISEKLGSQDIPAAFTVDSDGDEYIEFYPRTAWEYDMMCDQIIRDDFTIDGPRWQPTNMTPQPPPKPPTTLTASHEASPARTPTPQLSVNASRDGSLMGTPTPTPPGPIVKMIIVKVCNLLSSQRNVKLPLPAI
ncbi:hypothetical protein ACJJTC_018241 [Scirpophaga incertulas]